MMRAARFLLLLAPSLLLACGGTEPAPENVDKNILRFDTGEFEAPPGDSFECFYTSTRTDRELAASSLNGIQGPGGHHIIVYWTDVPRDPQHHPCNDAEMVSWHMIAGTGGEAVGQGVISLPEGLAVKVPAGKQLVMQSHYINTTGKTEKVTDTAELKYLDPSEVKSYANFYALADNSFEVPSHATYQSTTLCTVDRDFQFVLSLGHMHEFGTHYKLERIDDQGNVLETMHDEEWRPEYTSHPPVERWTMDQPLLLKKGTRLRQTCSWNNTSADALIFPREMCVGFFYYFPDQGELTCDLVPQPGGMP